MRSATSISAAARQSCCNDKGAIPLTFRETNVAPSLVPSNSTDGSSPPILFLHGLDSSAQTWKGVLDSLQADYRAVALDQRGCGRSPLGDPTEFSPGALVEDIYAFLGTHPYFRAPVEPGGGDENPAPPTIRPFVLVGHSMGGRVAMSFAATHPELVLALVVEDMDIRSRPLSESRVQSKDHASTLSFDRALGRRGIQTKDEILKLFCEREGYPSSQVEKWLTPQDERIEGVGTGECYSQVHPAFRLLCYQQFFETDHGKVVWEALAGAGGGASSPFPIHLLVADPTATICDDASLAAMATAMGTTVADADAPVLSPPSRRLAIRRYRGATHSIHNSRPDEFLTDLRAIVERAATRRSEA